MADTVLTCIRCPKGCQVQVSQDADGSILSIRGFSCPRGREYAQKEVTDPTRVVTTSVFVRGAGPRSRVSVKTAGEVPKALVEDVAHAVQRTCPRAPVRIGDVVVGNVCGTGVDVVATRACPACREA